MPECEQVNIYFFILSKKILNKHFRCRRSIIATHFDEVWDATQCNKMCDHCKYPDCYETIDITKYNKDICKIIKHARKFETRLTVIKLIDNWFKSGNSKTLRPPDVNKPSISKETAESVIAFLLINHYLKEDLHFTPYSTISYIDLGNYQNQNKKSLQVK